MTTPNTPLKPCPNVLCGESDKAYRYALHFAKALAERVGAPDNWKPADDLLTLIMQIDNMTTGLRPQVEVKPLDVTPLPWKIIPEHAFATTETVQYAVREAESGWYVQLECMRSVLVAEKLPTQASGIESANADYERRIISALSCDENAKEVSVAEAVRVLLKETTIAEKKAMNEAGIRAMKPGGWELSDLISFDQGRIAALSALGEQ